MKRFLFLFLITIVASCARPPIKREVKTQPAFTSEVTNPELKVIVDEFFALSKRNNITFTHKVSIGFSSIDSDTVIGTCSYRPSFREIDLDKEYWDRASWEQKVALVYHELAHCYCERDHDYDDGEMYPDNSIKAFLNGIMSRAPITPLRPPGYLDDSCPKSIMHPTIISRQCFKDHYDYYVKEMFARCEPF